MRTGGIVMTRLSRLARSLFEYGGIIAAVLVVIFLMFAAVSSSVPPEITPESVEMGALR